MIKPKMERTYTKTKKSLAIFLVFSIDKVHVLHANAFYSTSSIVQPWPFKGTDLLTRVEWSDDTTPHLVETLLNILNKKS